MRSALALAALLLAAQEPPADDLHVVQKANLVPVLELDTTFESIELAEFKIRTDGYQGDLMLLKVAAAGQAVRRGDTLLEVDRGPVEKQVAAAENDLRAAKAALEKARAEVDLGAQSDAVALAQAETALKNAETDLDVFLKVEGPQMLKQAELSVKYGEDGVKDQEEELDQLRKMYKSEELTNATSEIVVRRAERSLERARTYLEMTRQEAGVVKSVRHPQKLVSHTQSAEAARGSLAGLKAAQAHSKVQRETDLARARASVADLEEKLAKLRRDLEALVLKAPFDGRVYYGEFQRGQWSTADSLARTLRPGEKLQAGQVLLTVCGARTRAVAELPEASYFDVALDQAATVEPAAQPDVKLEGRVREKGVAGSSKATGSAFDLRIDFAEPPAVLLPGMKGKTTIRGTELAGVVVVPSAAVTTSGPKHTVTVSKDGKTSPREVAVGKTDGKRTQIKSGLEPGEKIVLPK